MFRRASRLRNRATITVATRPAIPDPLFDHQRDTPPPLLVRPPQPEARPNRWLFLWVGVLLMAFIGVSVSIGLVGILVWHSDWIFPGVQVLGVDLGQKTRGEATSTLEAFWQERSITLDAGGTAWEVTPEKLGIAFDPEATADLAHAQGRSLPSLARMIEKRGQVSIPPVWVFDASEARANLMGIAAQLEIEPVDAGLQVVEGRAYATQAVPGRRLDLDATLARLQQNPAEVFFAGKLSLAMEAVEPRVTDVSAAAAAANEILGRALTVVAFDPVQGTTTRWEIAPHVWGDWLTLKILDAGSGQFDWVMDTELARAFLLMQVQGLGADKYLDWETALAAIAAAVNDNTGEVSLRIYHHPTQHVVQSGETMASIGRSYGIPYPWIQQANPNAGERLSVGQSLTIPSPDDLLPLPVVEGRRVVVSIAEQRMWAYENGALKWDWPVSTGISDSPTSPGVFQIQSHETNAYAANWDLWMPYFMGIYRPVPTSGFMNGFHGFPTRDGANLLWTGDLGRRVTYGCILISTTNAAQLFEWAVEGVVVEVRP